MTIAYWSDSDLEAFGRPRCHVCNFVMERHEEHFGRRRGVGRWRPPICPECDAPIRHHRPPDSAGAEELIMRLSGGLEVEGTWHLPEYEMFEWVTNEEQLSEWVDFILREGVSEALDTPWFVARAATYKRFREQLSSGTFEWRMRRIEARVRSLLAAERAHHLHILEARREPDTNA